ncbi:MAG: glycyl-radical enzyme activating protein [Moorellales bacterium]
MPNATVESVQGVIFNIQRYCIHDGPGIRTTVFLKGCPLRCVWCQNPESQMVQPEVFFNREKCVGCGRCAAVCPNGAIEIHQGRARTDRGRCKGTGKCAEACPNEARSLMGRYVSAGEVFREVAEDEIFYEGSDGGVTLSGGEPLAQPEFAAAVLRLCKEAGIHTAVDTSGYARWETVKEVLDYADLVLFDFKHMDSAEHQRHTGVPNYLILENAKRIYRELGRPMWARIPVVPGYNDTEENVRATAEFIARELDNLVKVHLLPYHKMGEVKYDRLERRNGALGIKPPNEERMAELKGIVESFGLETVIGG